MGAFFIYDKNIISDVMPAFDLFAEMGFSSPSSIEIGHWMIYVYPKMTANKPSMISDKGCTAIAVGTPIYKALDCENSLVALLKDYLSGGINHEQLIGFYTILFCRGDTIEILRDPMGCKHLFTNIHHNMISSHMLAIGQCADNDLHINRKALYEKLMAGIIMPPNTLFEEIIQIDKQVAEHITKEKKGINFIRTDCMYIPEETTKSFDKCMNEQVMTLRSYFEKLEKAASKGIDLGLSGGYDSRLVLACIHQFITGKLHLHSHATENVHFKDLTIAKQMAQYVGVPCHIVSTKKLKNCDNVEEIIRKSILYFDGRSSFSIGGCGEVYTAKYREESTECTTLTITGIGGELYRNVFDVGFGKIQFDRFIEDKIFSHCFKKAISHALYQEIRDDVISRAALRLGVERGKKQSKAIAHRYYCEIMMIDGQGVALDAYNQVSYCVAPFLEPQIITKGYEAIPHHHSGGGFEGKLIHFIDPGLADIQSSYGYPISKRPIRAKIKEKMRTWVSSSLWNQLADSSNKKSKLYSVDDALEEFYAKSQTIKDAFSFMVELFPEIDFSQLMRSKEDIRRLQFVTMAIYFFKGRLKA